MLATEAAQPEEVRSQTALQKGVPAQVVTKNHLSLRDSDCKQLWPPFSPRAAFGIAATILALQQLEKYNGIVLVVDPPGSFPYGGTAHQPSGFDAGPIPGGLCPLYEKGFAGSSS